MVIKINITLMLVLFVVIIAIVYLPSVTIAASAENNTNQDRYIVTAANSGRVNSPDIVYSSITQGQTNWHSVTINSFITTLIVDLNWGNTSNSLQLTIYTPDGNVLGPYYDGADGKIDGQINIKITSSGGITQGTWYYKVYGYSVTGTQSYSI